MEAAQQSDLEKAARRAEAAETRVVELRRQAVDAEIRATAQGWVDPTDAPRYLDQRDRYVNDDGEIDAASIRTDLAAILADRPHLARVDGPRRPAPDPSQGARQPGSSGLDVQISDAQQSGDWRRSLALKAERALELAHQHGRS